MKRKFKSIPLLLCFVLCFTMMIPVYASSSDFDPVEEKIKHDTETAIAATVDSSEYVADNDEGLSEYRLADEKAANLLKETIENGADLDAAQHYYDITVSFGKEDRIESMYKMIELYNHVDVETQFVFDSYFLSYAPYADDENLLKQVNEICSDDNSASLFATYDREAAATWAFNNYSKYNTGYPDLRDLGGDCANFVSQAMHVGGGMAMSGDWYCYKKNTVYPKPATSSELDYSWTVSDPSPWISAKEFRNYWSSSSRSTTYEYDLADYKNGQTDAYSKPIYKGHAISLMNAVAWWYEAKHTMIVVGYDSNNKDYIFAAHSGATNDGRVKNVGSYDRVLFYAFK